MFESISAEGNKAISDIVFWAIHYDSITLPMMMHRFKLNEHTALTCMQSLESMGIVMKSPEENTMLWYVIVCEMKDLFPEIFGLLKFGGHSESEIIEAFKGLPLEKKEVQSNILNDSTHQWIAFNIDKPEINKPVIARICDDSKVYMESRTEVVHLEDIKIAKWDGFDWEIIGPHPKYDYSLLSNKEKLNDGAVVTHWAHVTEKEIEGWKTRLNPINKYDRLCLAVDDNNEEDVYRSLLLAAACIMKEANSLPADDPIRNKMLKAHSVMCDLQSVIDCGII